MNLTDIANYLYLFGNDIRFLHLAYVGQEFLFIHPYLNDLYDKIYDYYDELTEIGLAHEDLPSNPSVLLEIYKDKWEPITDRDMSYEWVVNRIIEKVEKLLGILNEAIEDKIDEKYDPSVLSLFDEIVTYLTREVMYKLQQSIK